jgi:RNA polymerase sigma factor (TIGR02999 family)
MASTAPPLDDLFSATYEELRRLAAAVSKNEASATLTPTALVNEAYLKLASGGAVTADSRLHFRRIAARAMRQVLVEAARRRLSAKRGGGVSAITLDDDIAAGSARAEELVALDQALDLLGRELPRPAAVVEYRFFGGFENGGDRGDARGFRGDGCFATGGWRVHGSRPRSPPKGEPGTDVYHSPRYLIAHF